MKMSTMDMVVWALIVIGGLNWGLVGAFDFNLVSSIFGAGSTLEMIIYIIIGLAAVWSLVSMFTKSNSTSQM
jgi:uncharacterized membrane protein YuzA (DUF378 family)